MATPLESIGEGKAIEITVTRELDCATAQQSAHRMALTIGFSGDAAHEITLVVAELASNLVKHARNGCLTLRPVKNAHRAGIEVEAADEGPGISDVERSMTDGYSTCGTLGYGMGTINRLADEMDISSAYGSGTRIVCRRWIRPALEPCAPRAWDIGVSTRAQASTGENGDAFIVKESHRELLVGLIDGLGHGEFAQRAALEAQRYVQTHFDQSLDKLFLGAGRACRATRGVVMALARLHSDGRLSFASVGNIEARARGPKERMPLVVQRGVLGSGEVRVQVQNFPWDPRWLLVLHTDGLRTSWQWEDFPMIDHDPVQRIAMKLMRKLDLENDDATVLAVTGNLP
jgi:anti-sigma regulatory factor (Ser/Thr protein kinase)